MRREYVPGSNPFNRDTPGRRKQRKRARAAALIIANRLREFRGLLSMKQMGEAAGKTTQAVAHYCREYGVPYKRLPKGSGGSTRMRKRIESKEYVPCLAYSFPWRPEPYPKNFVTRREWK